MNEHLKGHKQVKLAALLVEGIMRSETPEEALGTLIGVIANTANLIPPHHWEILEALASEPDHGEDCSPGCFCHHRYLFDALTKARTVQNANIERALKEGSDTDKILEPKQIVEVLTGPLSGQIKPGNN